MHFSPLFVPLLIGGCCPCFYGLKCKVMATKLPENCISTSNDYKKFLNVTWGIYIFREKIITWKKSLEDWFTSLINSRQKSSIPEIFRSTCATTIPPLLWEFSECLGKYVHYKALLLCMAPDLQTKSFLCVLFSFYKEFSPGVYESIWSHCIIVSEFHIIGPWHATLLNRVLIK